MNQIEKLKRDNRIYNSGYRAGHNDTVESCYVDIVDSEMDTYQSDNVSELINSLPSAPEDGMRKVIQETIYKQMINQPYIDEEPYSRLLTGLIMNALKDSSPPPPTVPVGSTGRESVMTKERIQEIREDIHLAVMSREDPNATDWECGEGILITPNEAKEYLSLLSIVSPPKTEGDEELSYCDCPVGLCTGAYPSSRCAFVIVRNVDKAFSESTQLQSESKAEGDGS